MKKNRLIELFAGIGSQAMALKRLKIDFEHYKICENDKFAVKSYNAIHDTNFMTSDIKELQAKDLEITDIDEFLYILTYSFPCQDLSVAGKMKGFENGSGTRSSLLWEVLRLLRKCENKPQILLMENVTQVHSKANFRHFQDFIHELSELGYHSYYEDLNAKNYGVPQNRNRHFMVSFQGNLGENFSFPGTFPLTKNLNDILEKDVDEKYFLPQIALETLIKKDFEFYSDINRTIRCGGAATFDKRHTFDVCVVGNLNYGVYKNVIEMHKRVYTDCGISPTICTMSGGGQEIKVTDKDIKCIRLLTELEIFRLMDFSDEDFYKLKEIGVSNRQIKKQAGNSICVGVLVAIFEQIFKII
jgi:DNA (cytosine-5)-methyltransferase 1